MIRLVIDASTLLAGIASPASRRSTPGLLVDALTDMTFEAVISPRLIAELDRGLAKPYFRSRIGEAEARRIVAGIRTAGVMFKDPAKPTPLLRDPEDDYLVALAIDAGARAIVTGDRDLLDHRDIRPPVIDAVAACQLLGLI